VDRSRDVQVDQVEVVLERRLVEASAHTDAGVDCSRVHGPAHEANTVVQRLHTGRCGQVCLDRLDIGSSRTQFGCGGVYPLVLSGDDEVEAVLGEHTGELEADAARGAGD